LKIIALGDTHGRDHWKEIAASNRFDKLIFIGDYFDSHGELSADIQISNFKEIVLFKKSFPEKVILLLGNHDYHYLDQTFGKYTGYQHEYENEISDLLVNAVDEKLIQIAFIWQRFLFTHAGVTKTWCSDKSIDLRDLENSINSLFISAPKSFMFNPGICGSSSGDDVTQSPIWVRPNSLLQDKIDNYIQIVGHTQYSRIEIRDNVAFIDTLGESGEYLVIEDEIMRSSG